MCAIPVAGRLELTLYAGVCVCEDGRQGPRDIGGHLEPRGKKKKTGGAQVEGEELGFYNAIDDLDDGVEGTEAEEVQ